MDWLKNNWFKVGVLLILLLLGVSYLGYISQKQSDLRNKEKTEYLGKRRMECYDILERERKAGKPAVSVQYYEPTSNPYDQERFNDSCRVTYEYQIKGDSGKTETITEGISF